MASCSTVDLGNSMPNGFEAPKAHFLHCYFKLTLSIGKEYANGRPCRHSGNFLYLYGDRRLIGNFCRHTLRSLRVSIPQKRTRFLIYIVPRKYDAASRGLDILSVDLVLCILVLHGHHYKFSNIRTQIAAPWSLGKKVLSF